MGNVCQPFEFSIDDGMKAFCVAELCVGIFHLIMSSVSFNIFDPLVNPPTGPSGINHQKQSLPTMLVMIMLLYIILMVTLIVQFVMGFLLYFLGFKKRNMTICIAWIIVACINFSIPWLALMCSAIYCSAEDPPGYKRCPTATYWSACWLYLLYIILGVWIVVVYMKWAKSTGIAVQYSTTPAGQPTSSQSHRSAKVSNQDNEA